MSGREDEENVDKNKLFNFMKKKKKENLSP
jgi:hypothetical protein